jgi:hypothetical protein
MSLPPTYSRRKREAEGMVDIYVYDKVPKKVKVQVVQILRDGLGDYERKNEYTPTSHLYDQIYKHMCRELGVHYLFLGGEVVLSLVRT